MTELSNIAFIELSLADGRPFDALAAGTFTDMLGRVVTIEPDALPAIVANTLAAIESARTESGELVGLPIDARGHDKGDGAGWIIGAEMAGDVVRLAPRWTEIGLELIGKGIRRLFSATVDLGQKVILGGTLTNWPAVRAKDGRMLLRPIELSHDLMALYQEGTIMPEELQEALLPVEPTPEPAAEPVAPVDERAELTAQVRQEVLASLKPADLLGETFVADLAASIRAEVKADLEQQYKMVAVAAQRDVHIAEFCQRVTGGTIAHPRGLPVKAERLEKVLGALDDATRAELEAILGSIHESGLIEFGEPGHGKELPSKAQLEPQLAAMLSQFVEQGGDAEAWFAVAGIGPAEEYDLSQYEVKHD